MLHFYFDLLCHTLQIYQGGVKPGHGNNHRYHNGKDVF